MNLAKLCGAAQRWHPHLNRAVLCSSVPIVYQYEKMRIPFLPVPCVSTRSQSERMSDPHPVLHSIIAASGTASQPMQLNFIYNALDTVLLIPWNHARIFRTSSHHNQQLHQQPFSWMHRRPNEARWRTICTRDFQCLRDRSLNKYQNEFQWRLQIDGLPIMNRQTNTRIFTRLGRKNWMNVRYAMKTIAAAN